MTVATDTEVKLDEKIEKVIHDPGKYHVIFLNDNQTPMEFVVEMLTQIFKHSPEGSLEAYLAAEGVVALLGERSEGVGVPEGGQEGVGGSVLA